MKWPRQSSQSDCADLGGVGEHLPYGGVLRVEDAQRAHRRLAARVLVEVGVVFGEEPAKLLDIRRPTAAVADRVQLETEPFDPEAARDLREQLDQLGVDGRIVRAHGLEVDLPELAIATLLGRRIAEHRRDAERLHGLRRTVQTVLDVGARDRRGRLGAKGEGATATVLERVHLLRDHVGSLAGRAGEELGVLERRRRDAPVPVPPGGRLGDTNDGLANGLLRREDVRGAARRLDLH